MLREQGFSPGSYPPRGPRRHAMPTIAVLPGDGIGPEVTTQAVKVLTRALEGTALALTIREAPIGGAAYEATGHPLPEDTLRLAQASDAILFGAVGGPKWDNL